jgi:streptogramin lyase
VTEASRIGGKVTTFDIPSGPKADPFGLCAGFDGTIWFAEQSQCNRIGRLNLKAVGNCSRGAVVYRTHASLATTTADRR